MATIIYNRYDDLPEQCQNCVYLKVASMRMDGDHYYSCGNYPLREKENCPKFIKDDVTLR